MSGGWKWLLNPSLKSKRWDLTFEKSNAFHSKQYITQDISNWNGGGGWRPKVILEEEVLLSPKAALWKWVWRPFLMASSLSLSARGVQPVARMQPRMAVNAAQRKIINLLKTFFFFAHPFSLVFVYLMCGPRQLFLFQCGPETPEGWMPLPDVKLRKAL